MIKNNPNTYLFRCSSLHKILAGTIGLPDGLYNKMLMYEKRKFDAGINLQKPLTEKMEEELQELQERHNAKELPTTMKKAIRDMWRQRTFRRDFIFTNKYIQKGIEQEERAITLFQDYHKKVLNKPVLITKNKERFSNKWITGEPDVKIGKSKNNKWVSGVDTKCVWSLETLPYKDDELSINYEAQNQGYMWLTGAKEWVTASVLVNATEHQLNNEKNKWYYAYNSPSEKDPFFDDYQKKLRQCELMMIYDYEKFVSDFPFHPMEIKKDEWFGEGYDMDLKHRVVVHESVYDRAFIEDLKERIEISRDYIRQLNKTL